jgi:acyl-CoA thioesterase-2
MAAGTDLSDGCRPASLHAYFVREGRSAAPIDYRVSHLNDQDPAVRIRHVTASQSGKPILILDVSFLACESPPPLPALGSGPDPAGWIPPGPDEARWLAEHSRRSQFELRFADKPSPVAGRSGEVASSHRFWLRTLDRLPDYVTQHACALTYASDMYLVSTALAAHGLPGRRPDVEAASLDHGIWFHQPARADDWVLYEQESVTSAGGRGLTSGQFLDRTGSVVATVRQEVLERLPAQLS